jgi:phage terminase large subunit-like protein
MASNVVAKSDAKDNIFPRKESPESKIDGIVAALFAMGRAMHAEESKGHAYQTRGFRTL